MEVSKTNNPINDSLSRNDLIDYAISKRVEELKSKKEEFSKQSKAEKDSLEKEIKKLDKEFVKICKQEIQEHIDENYKGTINALKTNLNKEPVISTPTDNSELSRELRYILRLGNFDAVIYFPSEKNKELRMGMGRMMDPFYILKAMEAFIIVKYDDANHDKSDAIKKEIKEKRKQIENINKIITEFNNEIRNVKNQKDVIKNSIIEQTLSSTDEGLKILESLNNIVLPGEKLLNS